MGFGFATSAPSSAPLALLQVILNACRLGTYVLKTSRGRSFWACLDPQLPPEPPLALNPLSPLLEQADQALGHNQPPN
jgi:hypothetical protein